MSESRRALVLEDIDKVWVEYDRSTDTLNIIFGEGSEEADEAILTESDVGYRIKEGRVIGITIYNFMKRLGIEL
ncbi:MAG: DUF2283 domain-containing protein [Sulfolobales archaeon]|nr:DUF2283 domain-containing protein [Sulfolobales archaeon]MCX8209152.1 DUF2283 domain-containing protein [Sulfolobales archaeon]MDW8010686.1 DUF2283 domain-containing protein [Sulfolobales archaeon]